MTGRQYKRFDYHGHPEADRVVVAMGSSTSTVQEAVDHMNGMGERTGLLKVRLYRPWDADALRAAIPQSAKDITVLDRTREDGAVGQARRRRPPRAPPPPDHPISPPSRALQPLFLDVSASYALATGEERKKIVGGQYGLASKEFTPKHVVAAFENMRRIAQPKHNYVVGIRDDVTMTSLEVGPEIDTIPEGTKQCLFWGLGTDGTVGANKAAIKTISSNTELFGQGHFAVRLAQGRRRDDVAHPVRPVAAHARVRDPAGRRLHRVRQHLVRHQVRHDQDGGARRHLPPQHAVGGRRVREDAPHQDEADDRRAQPRLLHDRRHPRRQGGGARPAHQHGDAVGLLPPLGRAAGRAGDRVSSRTTS